MTQSFCDQCGAALSPGSKFCAACGVQVQPAAAPAKSETTQAAPQPPQPAAPPAPVATATASRAPNKFSQDGTPLTGFLKNRVAFVLVYLLVIAPTYVLPYLGSNSALVGLAGQATGAGNLPQFWMHVTALFLAVVVAWFRGIYIGKSWIAIFPFFAALFDMLPGFNWVFLAPTAFHVVTVIMGVRGEVAGNQVGKLQFVGAMVTTALLIAVTAVQITNYDDLNYKRLPTVAATAPKPQGNTRSTAEVPASNSVTPRLPSGTPPSKLPSAAATASGPSLGPDPALALGRSLVDPEGTTIETGGFTGLKVGHTREQAEQFFQRPLVPWQNQKCKDARWQALAPDDYRGVVVYLLNGQIVGFNVYSGRYRTRSGLQIGDTERRLNELYGNDSTLEREELPTLDGRVSSAMHWLGRSGATFLGIHTHDGKVNGFNFGSSREIKMIGQPCWE